MPSPTSTILFLDSSVVLGYVVGQHKTKLSKLSTDIAASKVSCGVSDSVENECSTKIKGLTDYLGKMIMGVIGGQVAEQRKSVKQSLDASVDKRDIVAMELAFREMYAGKHKLPSSPTSNVLDLQTVEIFMVNGLESMVKSSSPPNYYVAMTKLAALVLKYMTDAKTSYDTLIAIKHTLATVHTLSPDTNDITSLELIGLEHPDARHVASALQAQKSGACKKAVFVSLDYRTILKFQFDILNKLGIWCTDPLYAIHHS